MLIVVDEVQEGGDGGVGVGEEDHLIQTIDQVSWNLKLTLYLSSRHFIFD